MNNKKCRHCRTLINVDASVCGQCQYGQSWYSAPKIKLFLESFAVAITLAGALYAASEASNAESTKAEIQELSTQNAAQEERIQKALAEANVLNEKFNTSNVEVNKKLVNISTKSEKISTDLAASILESENIRAGSVQLKEQVDKTLSARDISYLVGKTKADNHCSSATNAKSVTAIRLSRYHFGQTADAICALDLNTVSKKASCEAVPSLIVRADGSTTPYPARDLNCNSPISVAWPWGSSSKYSSTHPGEWSYGDTHIICCK